MTIWNLLVVLCFVALYLAVSLVFLQVQKLREELKVARSEPDVEPMDPSEYVAVVRREIAGLEERFDSSLQAIPEQLRKELQSIQADMRFLVRPGSGGTLSKVSENTGGQPGMSDAYREARLLLANGVDEERVVSETGLAVEEVSLLKRISRNQEEYS
ncbi:MAG: hypothetical protein HQM02_07175 [Magnetococcales bacterium]|nr:hypothetical protein [Magnetococcales bacterium]